MVMAGAAVVNAVGEGTSAYIEFCIDMTAYAAAPATPRTVQAR